MSCSVPVALCCALGNDNPFPGRVWHIVCGPHVFSCWSEERWMSAFWEHLLCEMLRALSAGVCIYHGRAECQSREATQQELHRCVLRAFLVQCLKLFQLIQGKQNTTWIYRWGLRQPKTGKDNVPSLGEDAGKCWKQTQLSCLAESHWGPCTVISNVIRWAGKVKLQDTVVHVIWPKWFAKQSRTEEK